MNREPRTKSNEPQTTNNELPTTNFSAFCLRTTNYELPTIYMQNKPNFRKAKMNINSAIAKDYKNIPPTNKMKNKPNQTQFQPKTNPIEPNFYTNYAKQTQSNPVSCENGEIHNFRKVLQLLATFCNFSPSTALKTCDIYQLPNHWLPIPFNSATISMLFTPSLRL